jgi:hypothetical protein
MSRGGAALSALLIVLAFGASYALSAESKDRQTRAVEVPGKPASTLSVSEEGLRTGLLGSAPQIPSTLNLEPVKRKAAAKPAPTPAPASAPTATPTPDRAPAGAPEPTPPTSPAPAPNPDAGTGQTFDDSG